MYLFDIQAPGKSLLLLIGIACATVLIESPFGG
jgi:hypothetical protein